MASQSNPSSVPREGFLRPPPPGPHDLVILARDDEFYLLKREAYQDGKHVIKDSMLSQAKLLVKQGVVLADIPVGSIPGVGAMCYLVNLSSFGPRKQPPVAPPKDDPPEVNLEPLADNDPRFGPPPAMDDLVIVGRLGLAYYWVKKQEYQSPECRLDKLDPILEEQVRLLTTQGVVIADVSGGTLPGVTNMGCLVNLKGIHRPEAKEALAQQMPPSSQDG